jgi:hypothetical protein
MLAGGPLAAALEAAERDLSEVIELAPDSAFRLERARNVKRLKDAIAAARIEAPKCSTEEAAEILGVSARQATKLAKAGKVKAEQGADGHRWTFDVRSCHAYAQHSNRKRTA